MAKFNNIEFGNKLRSARIKKEFSLEFVGKKIGKNASTVARYEKGKIIPNAEIINKLCDLLDIYNGDLYSETEIKIVNKENSKNPFKTNRLYLYYKGYVGKKKLGKYKFIIDLVEQKDYIQVKILDYKKKKVILIGYMLADDNMVSIRTENYKPNCPRLETNQIIINISGGTNGILLGIMACTNGNYIPNIKKCLISKKDLIFTDKMISILDLSKEEQDNILNDSIWIADIEQVEEYEYKLENK